MPALDRTTMMRAFYGRDAAFEAPVPEGSFRNPVLAGFHSDPSVTAANGRFYLVASTFAFFPGIPVFESEDLVHWTQVGNAIHRPGQLDFDGLGMSRGVFAPAIEHRDGTFYIANTCVDCGEQSPQTETNYTLISSRYGWRLSLASAVAAQAECLVERGELALQLGHLGLRQRPRQLRHLHLQPLERGLPLAVRGGRTLKLPLPPPILHLDHG